MRPFQTKKGQMARVPGPGVRRWALYDTGGAAMRRYSVCVVVVVVGLSSCSRDRGTGGDAPGPPRSPEARVTTEMRTDAPRPPRSPQLSVTAEVSRGFHTGMGLGSSDATYEVALEISNDGNDILTFDEVIGGFLPPEPAKPLQMTTTQNEGEPFRLPPGESLNLQFTSDGYTTPLLLDAGDAGLMFAVALRANGKTLGRRYAAKLPDLSDLPDAYSGEGHKLVLEPK